MNKRADDEHRLDEWVVGRLDREDENEQRSLFERRENEDCGGHLKAFQKQCQSTYFVSSPDPPCRSALNFTTYAAPDTRHQVKVCVLLTLPNMPSLRRDTSFSTD
jgi:hypothetical protein